MKKFISGLTAFLLALSCSAMVFANQAQTSEEAHQTADIMDAVLPVLLMVAVSLAARPFFKKMRQARLDKQKNEHK